MATVEYFEDTFIGVDSFHQPSSVAAGFLPVADNVLIDGKDIITRPGKRGMLTTPFGAPIYEPCPFVKADKSTDIVFTSGGKLYHLPKTAASATEILKGGASFSLNSPGVFLERAGKYLYGIDGVGKMFRTDLTTGADCYGLDAPPAPAVALTSSLIDACADATKWTVDSLTGSGATNRVVNGDFSAGPSTLDGFGRIAARDNWTAGGTGDYNTAIPLSGGGTLPGTWAILDTPGDSFTSDAMANDVESLDTARYATSFFVGYQYYNPPDGAHFSNKDASVIAIARAYAAAGGAGAELARATIERVLPQNGDQAATLGDVFEFGEMQTPILSYTVEFIAGSQNNDESIGPVITDIVSYPLVPGLTVGQVGTSPITLTPVHLSDDLPIEAQGTMFLNGTHVRHDLGSATDLTGADHLLIGLGTGAPEGLAFRLRLQKSGVTTWEDTNRVTLSDDRTYASIDISTVDLDVRQACRYIEFVFLADATKVGSGAFTIGPLTAAGDLSIGRADYTYEVTEIDASADPTNLIDIIESNPSALSSALTPTVQQAQAAVTLPAAVNGTTTHMGVYRYGGGAEDGFWRLVGVVSLSANTVTSAPGKVTWNHTTRLFVDNTEDVALLEAATAPSGHDAPPVGAQAIAYWQGRICLAVGSRLYISDLVDDDTSAGLYFPVIDDPEAPTAATDGAQFGVGKQDNDDIARLIAFGTHLILLKGRSIWVATGVDAADFQVQSYLLKAGVGCVAPRAAGIVGNVVWFRAASGLMQFNADVVDPVSVSVEKGLSLATSAAGNALVYHGRRMYLFSPDAGSGTNSVAYVWDSRQNGYTRFLQMNATGAASLSGGQDSEDLYLAGLDGQMYHMGRPEDPAASGDKATPAASVTAVAWDVDTRGFKGNDFRYAQVPNHVYFDAVTTETVAITWGVKDADSARAVTSTYTITGTDMAPDHSTPRLRVPGGLRAKALQVTLSGSCKEQLRLQGIGLVATTGRRLAA